MNIKKIIKPITPLMKECFKENNICYCQQQILKVFKDLNKQVAVFSMVEQKEKPKIKESCD
jgi:hypothetical protein